MTEIGEVVSYKGSTVELRLVESEHCRSCPSSGGCHASMDLGISGERRLEAQSRFKTRPGDRVEVVIPENKRLAAGLVVFVLPVLLALVGAVLGSLIAPGNISTGIGAGVGLALGILGAVIIDRVMDRRTSLRPQVTRIVERGAPACHEGR